MTYEPGTNPLSTRADAEQEATDREHEQAAPNRAKDTDDHRTQRNRQEQTPWVQSKRRKESKECGTGRLRVFRMRDVSHTDVTVP